MVVKITARTKWKKEIDLDENTDRISRKSTIQADFETQTENSLLVWKFNVKKKWFNLVILPNNILCVPNVNSLIKPL